MRRDIIIVCVAVLIAWLSPTTASIGETPSFALANGSRHFATGVSNVKQARAKEFTALKLLGATLVHRSVKWNEIAPISEPTNWIARDPLSKHYDWRELDEWVMQAHRARLIPMLTLD